MAKAKHTLTHTLHSNAHAFHPSSTALRERGSIAHTNGVDFNEEHINTVILVLVGDIFANLV